MIEGILIVGMILQPCAPGERIDTREQIRNLDHARIDPLAWGARLKDHPDDQDALDHFATFVFDALDRQIFPNGIMDGSTWFHPEEAMLLLAEQRGSDLIAALDRILARGAKHAFSFHAFPVMLAIKALMRTIPIEGARIWDALWPAYRQSSWQLDSYESLPFTAPAAALTPLCDRLLADVNTDQAFSNIVGWAIDGGREGWLMERIDRALCGETAADRACAFTLVRFLDPTPAAEAAALRAGADVPSEWLSGVTEMSEAAQMRARAAFYWRERFLATNDPDQCHPSMTLFLACADARAITLFERRIAERSRDLGRTQLAHLGSVRSGTQTGCEEERRRSGKAAVRAGHPAVHPFPLAGKPGLHLRWKSFSLERVEVAARSSRPAKPTIKCAEALGDVHIPGHTARIDGPARHIACLFREEI